MNKVKKGYKQTEIGIIPEEWEVKELGSFANVSLGGTPSREVLSYWDGSIPWITTSQIDFNIIKDANEFITEEGLNNSAAKLFKSGNLLMAMYGQGKTRGKVAILGIDATTNQACAAILLNKSVLREYIFCNISGRYDEIRNLSNTGGQENLSGDLIKKIQIPLPPLPEQNAIAQVLSDTDKLIQALEKLIAKKHRIKQGAMQKLLTPKEGWEVKTLGEIAEITGAGIDKKINPTEKPVVLLNYMDVFKRDYIFKNELYHKVTAPQNKLKSCNVKKGDIFLTPSSELRTDIGISAIAMEDMEGVVYSYHIYRLRYFIDLDKLFGLYMLKTRHFLEQSETMCEGSGKRYVVSMGKFRSMYVSLPNSKQEQTRIATILSDMDLEIEALEKKTAKYRQIKQGMMQVLLTGKIRLV